MDFTLHVFEKLLKTFIDKGYQFQTFHNFFISPLSKVVVLRHDVDCRPQNALLLAHLEYNLGIKSTYYFRIVKQSFNESIIKKIYNLGHEIGYHYEDLALAKGDFNKAYELFCNHLEILRNIVPINTICMHGSPISRWDNRLLWKKYDYKKLNIIGEPYLDIDYTKVMYLTDTGRCWNSNNINIRDKVNSSFNYNFKTTNDIIVFLQQYNFPDKIIINTHPQRWSNNYLFLTKDYFLQQLKNFIKIIINKYYYKKIIAH